MSATDYTLPPLPLPGAASFAPQVEAYGHACAEAARAPLLARIAELEAEVSEFETARRAWLAAQAINERTIDRLRAEVEALRAKIERAEVSYGNMLRADDKRPDRTTEYTRGWGDCLRAIAAQRGEGEG